MRTALLIGSLMLLLLLSILAFGCIGPGPITTVSLDPAVEDRFPVVTGINLQGDEVLMPQAFEGDKNLIAIAFFQRQQRQVNTWIDELEVFQAEEPALRFYELPTIESGNAAFRMWVNNGMRSGIRDEIARERTITLYLDREPFLQALAIPDMTEIHMFLLDDEGQILWRTEGAVTAEKRSSLSEALRRG